MTECRFQKAAEGPVVTSKPHHRTSPSDSAAAIPQGQDYQEFANSAPDGIELLVDLYSPHGKQCANGAGANRLRRGGMVSLNRAGFAGGSNTQFQ
jgi:hypothetical protein